MKRTLPILMIIIPFVFVCSCATLDSTTRTTGPAAASGEPEPFYVGKSGLKLFPEPRFSRTSIAELPLHEKVLRDKLEKGFAHVTVIKTGQSGWVNNAHLVWRIPADKAAPVKPAAPPPGPVKSPPKEDVIQAPSQPNPDADGRDASIFNAF